MLSLSTSPGSDDNPTGRPDDDTASSVPTRMEVEKDG
jgi:hypothetical protein